jgi:hypothetical protein
MKMHGRPWNIVFLFILLFVLTACAGGGVDWVQPTPEPVQADEFTNIVESDLVLYEVKVLVASNAEGITYNKEYHYVYDCSLDLMHIHHCPYYPVLRDCTMTTTPIPSAVFGSGICQ